MKATPKVRVTVYLSTDVREKVDQAAAEAKLSRSAFVEAVLKKHFQEQAQTSALSG
jgi:metal-responsive CopG/Arc/MetJ family transcriptional regulator